MEILQLPQRFKIVGRIEKNFHWSGLGDLKVTPIYKSSELWKSILQNNKDKFHQDNLDNFRKIGNINKRLSSWDPMDNSTRYFKTLLMHFCSKLDKKFYDSNLQFGATLDNISEQNVGNPITVKYLGRDISLDYALCLEEILFLSDTLGAQTKILEIGAGFGRTCHSFLSIFNNIEEYIICDLPEMLNLSSSYLNSVLPEALFEKITFLENDKIGEVGKINLVVNINSFQEMRREVIESYLSVIANTSDFLFCKNPTGKYDPKAINLEIKNIQEFEFAMELGLCNEVVDIFDTEDLELASRNYIKNYQPTNFQVKKHEKSELWAQHHSVLYQRC